MNDTKVIQIIKVEWQGKQGDTMTDIIGLAEDGNLYRWHKGTGKWILYVINN